MERNSQFMSLPKSMVDALQKEEMLLVAGGSVGQEASTTNNADGTCSGTNNDSGKCTGTNNGSGKCNVSLEDHVLHWNCIINKSVAHHQWATLTIRIIYIWNIHELKKSGQSECKLEIKCYLCCVKPTLSNYD